MNQYRSLTYLTLLLCLNMLNSATAETITSQPACRAEVYLQDKIAALNAAGAKIIYSSHILQPWMRIKPGMEHNISSSEQLPVLLQPYGLIVKSGAAGSLIIVPDEQRPVGSIEGRILDASSNQPVQYANIHIVGTEKTVTSDHNGCFVFFDVAPGTYTLNISATGYQMQMADQLRIDGRDVRYTMLHLQPVEKKRLLEEHVVVGSRFSMMSENAGNHQFLDKDEVDKTPHLADDVSRALRYLPGAASSDYSPKIHVRGGDIRETQIIVDGLELIDPFHLKSIGGGIFNIIDSNMVREIDYLSGGYTAEYGNSMSAVVNIDTLDPDDLKYRYIMGLSFANMFARTQGHFAQQQGSWLVSVRRGYLDILLKTSEGSDPDESILKYYDVQNKIQYSLSDTTQLSFNMLLAGDRVVMDSEVPGESISDGDSGSHYLWATLQNDWTHRLYSKTILSFGHLERERWAVEPEDPIAFLQDNRNTEFDGLRSDWTMNLTAQQLLKWGVNIRDTTAQYAYDLESITARMDGTADTVNLSRHYHLRTVGKTYAGYFSHRLQWHPRIITELGARWDKQTHTPDKDAQFGPRVNMLFELGKQIQLRLAWGKFYQAQAVEALPIEDGVVHYSPAQHAVHAIVGIQRSLSSGLSWRLDLYKKDYADLQARYENLFSGYNPINEAEADRIRIAPENAIAAGAEFSLRWNAGSVFSWWLNYAHSSIEDHIDGVNVPRSWDQKHSYNIGLNWALNEWNINLTGIRRSGWPATKIDYLQIPSPQGMGIVALAGERNQIRHAGFSRFDIRAHKEIPKPYGSYKYYVELFNILNHDNPCCHNVGDSDNIEALHSGQYKPTYDNWLPRVISFGVIWSF